MKLIIRNTLHVEGYENHLYGICYVCNGVAHICQLGDFEEYNDDDEMIIIDSELVDMNEETRVDPSYEEAYKFRLRDGVIPNNHKGIRVPCSCEHDAISFKASL